MSRISTNQGSRLRMNDNFSKPDLSGGGVKSIPVWIKVTSTVLFELHLIINSTEKCYSQQHRISFK